MRPTPHRTPNLTLVALLWLLSSIPLTARAQDGGLTGRAVIFNVLSYNDPAAPFFIGTDYAGKVTQGPEFGMIREGYDGMAVVPMLIDLSDTRIDLSYAQNQPGQFTPGQPSSGQFTPGQPSSGQFTPGQPSSGQFTAAKFNGYVMRFSTDCVLIGGAEIDPKTTTLPLTDANLILTPQSLSLNVAGLAYDRTTRIGITLSVMDCPVS